MPSASKNPDLSSAPALPATEFSNRAQDVRVRTWKTRSGETLGKCVEFLYIDGRSAKVLLTADLQRKLFGSFGVDYSDAKPWGDLPNLPMASEDGSRRTEDPSTRSTSSGQASSGQAGGLR